MNHNQSLEIIKEVKNEYEKRWLALPQVKAVGIGLLKNDRQGIIISIEKYSADLKQQIPAQIRGIPIELRESGTFKAL